MSIHPLITRLAHAEGLPRQEILACRAQRDELIAVFLDIMRRAPSGALGVEEYDSVFFVLHLLGEFADPAACQPLLRFLLSDPVQVEEILGDAITETLPCILISVYDGDHAALEAALGDGAVDQFVRAAIFDAWTYHVLAGRIDRDHARSFLSDFTPSGDEARFLWAQWLNAVAYLSMVELTDRAQDVCRRGLIDPQHMGFADFERLVARVQAAGDGLSILAADHRRPFTDTIAELSGWYGFSEAYLRSQRQSERVRDIVINPNRHIGRNDPCPCGSGKKFKKCCGG